jgi:arginyl-tRNA synthetase
MFQLLTTEANQIVKSLFTLEDMPVEWQKPKDPTHGDITTIVALKIARVKGVKPQDVATQIADALRNSPSVEKAEVAGAGYVNVWLKPAVLLQELEATVEACSPRKTRDEAPVIIEFSQPNIAKPLAIHHIIGTVLGQAMVNLYRHEGSHVLSWNYIGDWGTQFGKLAVAYEKWGNQKPVKDYSLDELLDLYVKFHEEVQNDETLEDQGRKAFRELEQGDAALRAFWQDVVSVTKSSLAGIYERLHVSFDLDLGESFYEDKMEGLLAEGKKKHVFVEGEGGSLIVQFPEEKHMPPYLVVKGDGATLYSTRDLAQMRYRVDTYHPKEILIFTDIAQKLHFEQLMETCTMLGWELPTFENVLFGRMRFVDKSMSTRKGNVLKLEHVIDEAVARAEDILKERGDSIHTDDPKKLAEMMGVGALVYGILSQNRKMDLVFDWDKMLSFEGNSAPYLQYTHARAKSVLRKVEAEIGDQRSEIGVTELSTSERILIGTLLQYPHVLSEARSEHLPHKLANYLYQLCQDFNSFYNTESILQAETSVRDLRLHLTSLTASVLKSGAELLTLRVPERM